MTALIAPSGLAKSIYLAAHTLSRMNHRQLAGIGERKLREQLVPRLPIDFDRRYERRVPTDPPTRPAPIERNTATIRESLDETTRDRYQRRATAAADGAPKFMNRRLDIVEGTEVNWYDDRLDSLPGLWSFKLYGFQPLAWACNGVDPCSDDAAEYQTTFDGWIRDWMASVEIGRSQYLRRAWTPWSVSIRLVNWSRYLAWRKAVDSVTPNSEFERAFRREIYKNAVFLRNNIEWEVDGNHLIENGAALTVAGLLFGKFGWTERGVSILSDAGRDQFLDSGFHFERSPMYHVLVLTRYLTVCDLLGRYDHPVPEQLRVIAEAATGFLRFLRPPNGRIPLLNDSVYGEALPLESCLEYASRLEGLRIDTGEQAADRASRVSTDSAQDFCWLQTETGTMLIDGGPVGPPHLPGHSHSDTLGLLLWLDDQPVVTDTGTFGYIRGSYRDYARGARGHNTLQVGDIEPIAIGGKYLMGPRPVPTTRIADGPVSLFEGSYDADPYGGPAYTYHRAVYGGDRWWLISDTATGHENASVLSRLHLHPDVSPLLKPSGHVRLEPAEDAQRVYVHPLDGTRISLTSGWYFPEFGTATDRPVLELHAGDDPPDESVVRFLITTHQLPEPRLETTTGAGDSGQLKMDGSSYRLPETQLPTE